MRSVCVFALASSVALAVAGCSPSIDKIEIAPPTMTIVSEADAKTLTATPKDKEGNPIEGKAITWSSSDPAVAAVDSAGKVKPAGTGKATITAAFEEHKGTAVVEVLLLKSIKLDSPAMVVKVGTPSAPLKIAYMNEKGDPITLPNPKVEWKSADPNIATVGSDGVVAGVAAGSTTVSARVNELSADIAVTVNPADPPPDAGPAPAAADAGPAAAK